jgi:hypothetical protein
MWCLGAQELGRVHRMMKWLNSIVPLPASLMIRPFAEWRARYTTYLKERGMYVKTNDSEWLAFIRPTSLQ